MSYFAVTYTYVADADALDSVRPRHRQYLATLEGRTLVASGPYVNANPPGALLLMKADNEEQVTADLDADPMWREGLIERRTIHLWNPVLGQLP